VKVAIINRHPSDVLGGSEMQCANIAAGLSRRGHDVAYIAPSNGFRSSKAEPYRIIPVKPTPRDIAAAIVAHNADVIYWRFNKYYLLRTMWKLASEKIPVVFAISHINDTKVFSHYANPRSGVRSLLRTVKQLAASSLNHMGFRYVSGVTTLNPDFLNILPVARQCFVPNSVELQARSFSWPRPYVVWVANLKPTKRPELFLKLAAALAGKGMDFLMVGAIQAPEYEWIAKSGAEHAVHYLGPKSLEETNGIIGQALALVHTCRPEGFGNNFLQAWLQGVPTVSLGFDPAGLIAKFGLGGFADGRWDLFVSQVEALIANPDGAKEIGRRAKAFAEQRFSVDRTLETLESFLMEIVEDKPQAKMAVAT